MAVHNGSLLYCQNILNVFEHINYSELKQKRNYIEAFAYAVNYKSLTMFYTVAPQDGTTTGNLRQILALQEVTSVITDLFLK